MKNRIAVPFIFLIASILMVGLTCNLGTSTATAPTQPGQGGESTNTVEAVGAINNIQDVRKATIQIESTGTFVDPQEGLEVNAAGRGSGFIIDPSGIAVTNNHVVTGAALIKVWVNGESTSRNARILGVSECSDLAVIDIDGEGYSYLNWYNLQPQVSMEVYTAGFPLGAPEFSMTKGIISKERVDGQTNWASLDYVLGHDATINPGNSGGPLVTADGQVVGINYRGNKGTDQYFAIGAAIAKPIVDQLMTGKDIDSIGINGTAFVSEDNSISGIWISSVKSGSPADKTGMKAGDILLQMEGLVLGTDGTMKDYCDILRTHQPSDTLSVKVYRYSTGEILAGQLNGRTLEASLSDTGNLPSATQSSEQALDYFTDDFSGDLSNWTYNVFTGDENYLSLTTDQGGLLARLEDVNLSVYFYYDPFVYNDVLLDLTYRNQGRNSNNVNVVCRYSDAGWYEFTVQNDGLYQIWAYSGDYHMLADGGSTAIRTGQSPNEITVGCVGNTLTLYINGVSARSVKDTVYFLGQGQVGFGVNISPTNPVIPVAVNFDTFTIAQP